MEFNTDNILTEWSYRVPTGIIDLDDPYHIVILGDILHEGKYPPGFAKKMLENISAPSVELYKTDHDSNSDYRFVLDEINEQDAQFQNFNETTV